jgi:phosphate transport system ATP-binding protein
MTDAVRPAPAATPVRVVVPPPVAALRLAPGDSPPASGGAPRVELRGLTASYGRRVAVRDVSLTCPAGAVTAIIGPSGCGKSTLLRCINRLHETVPGASMTGRILLDDEPVDGAAADAIALRRRVGMVFQRPTPFPTLSIFENVAAALRAGDRGLRQVELVERVERALRRAALWDEVKDRLRGSAVSLSGGQQQRLCMARALAAEPAVLLLDEPTASLDPMGTQRIEELLYELRGSVTVVIVTHNMQQAARVSDLTAFLLDTRLVEAAPTRTLFTTPGDPRTEAYITGRFG